MVKRVPEEKMVYETNTPAEVVTDGKKSIRWPLIFGIFGIVVTILMAIGIVVYKEHVQALQNYGYIGAFFISILGGATVIVPVPMLAVVFALGGCNGIPLAGGDSRSTGRTSGRPDDILNRPQRQPCYQSDQT